MNTRINGRLAKPNFQVLYATLLIAAVLAAVASVGVPTNFLFKNALGQNATNQTQVGGQSQAMANQTSQNMIEQIKPILDRIDKARDALRTSDNPRALDEINAADIEIIKITQNLTE